MPSQMISTARTHYLRLPAESSVDREGRAVFPPAYRGRAFYSAGTNHEQGFTLLELLLVLFIVGLMTASAILMTDGVQNQSKYDETRHRMALIRHAIGGDPARTVNGQSDLGGFVADIGRPPNTLQELLEAGTLPAYTQDPASGLWAGWRGPYLDAATESGGSKAFRDGYLNAGPAPNYGWGFAVAPGGDVALSSVGANPTDAADDVFEAQLLTAADYELPLSAVKVNLHNRNGTDSVAQTGNLRLRIYYPQDGAIVAPGIDTDSDPFSAPALSAVQSVQITATFSPMLEVPVGTRGYVVVCEDATPANRRIFDGDCDAGNPLPAIAHAVHFTVAPRMPPAALDWILQ